MIIWVNGTFGVGKTTTVEQLQERIPGARVFDPETVGYMLRWNLEDRPVDDFQDWPSWRRLVIATAAELSRYTGEHLICPQTVLNADYLEEIHSGLQAAGLTVRHVLLDADESTLRAHIQASGEAVEWRLGHVSTYLQARPWLMAAADLTVDVGAHDPAGVATAIVEDTVAAGQLLA